eukprot:922167-Rhodomonas_salina.2
MLLRPVGRGRASAVPGSSLRAMYPMSGTPIRSVQSRTGESDKGLEIWEQPTTCPVQFAPGMRILVFDFEACQAATYRAEDLDDDDKSALRAMHRDRKPKENLDDGTAEAVMSKEELAFQVRNQRQKLVGLVQSVPGMPLIPRVLEMVPIEALCTDLGCGATGRLVLKTGTVAPGATGGNGSVDGARPIMLELTETGADDARPTLVLTGTVVLLVLPRGAAVLTRWASQTTRDLQIESTLLQQHTSRVRVPASAIVYATSYAYHLRVLPTYLCVQATVPATRFTCAASYTE